MTELVTAIYKRETYAGEEILRLVAVICNEPIPEKYNSYEYKFKIMQLEECKW